MDKWWQKPLRAVTLEFPASDVAAIDVKGIINETYRGAVNTICVFSIGYYPGGTAFYQSHLAPHYPGLGERDLLAEAIEAGHRNGQKVIAYIGSIWGGREMYLSHPDWAQRKADGRVTSWDEAYNSVAMCPNSPYREYLKGVLQEISEQYVVDGFYFDEPSFQSWCNCSYCREKFYTEYHQELPVEEKWGDPVFQVFLGWRYRQIGAWRRELYDLVKREDRCVFHQGAYPFSFLVPRPFETSGIQYRYWYQERFASSWYIPLAHGVFLPDSAKNGDVVHFEPYRHMVNDPIWNYGLSLRYGQSIGHGKQMLVLNMMAQTPFDLYGLPETEIRLSIAELLANSGSPLFARYYPDRVDRQAWEYVYAGLREARELEPYLSQRESVKYAALLFSQSSLDRFDHQGDKPSHLNCLKGFAKALLQEQVLFDVLTEADLERLNEYQVVVLPNASCLSGEAKRAIWAYAVHGGGVVASYEAGMYDEQGGRTAEDDLREVLGVAYREEEPQYVGFDVYMRIGEVGRLIANIPEGKLVPTGGVQVEVVEAGARAVAEVLGSAAVHYGPLGDALGRPSVLVKERAEGGRAVYFALPVGNRYLEFGVGAHRELIVGAVRWAAGGEAEVQLQSAPHTMALTAYRQGGGKRLVVHLVNSVRDEVVRPIEEIAESCGMQLKVKMGGDVKKVQVLRSNLEVSWGMEDGILVVDLPPVRDSEVILVEFC